jgi:transcription antitermination factor NusG
MTSIDNNDHEWWAVQVWSGREPLTTQHLRVRGYEVFLPSYVVQRRWSDRVKNVRQPLFGGYVFCRADVQAVGKIVETPGVIRIVGTRMGPIPVAPDEIKTLQRLVETRLSVEPWPFLRAGQRVRIDAGPLRDTEGILLLAKNRHRLVVSVTLLQRSVAVEIDSEWVSVPAAAWLEQPVD